MHHGICEICDDIVHLCMVNGMMGQDIEEGLIAALMVIVALLLLLLLMIGKFVKFVKVEFVGK